MDGSWVIGMQTAAEVLVLETVAAFVLYHLARFLLVEKVKPRIFDGMLMGCGYGGVLFRVVDPRWWELRRWYEWWRSPLTKARMTIDGKDYRVILVVSDHVAPPSKDWN